MSNTQNNSGAKIKLTKTKFILVFIALLIGFFAPPFTAVARPTMLPTILTQYNAMQYFATISIIGTISMAISAPLAGKQSKNDPAGALGNSVPASRRTQP